MLRDRRHLAGDGVVVAVVAMNAHTGRIEQDRSWITRGFVVDATTGALLDAAAARLRALAEKATGEARTDQGVMGERVRVELQRFSADGAAGGHWCCRSSWRSDPWLPPPCPVERAR